MSAIKIPDLCLVVLVGVSGSGKSSFARRHFAETEIVSSDACRALVSDDENDQTATESAFAVLHSIASERLKLGKLTVIDATNVQRDARAPYYQEISTILNDELPKLWLWYEVRPMGFNKRIVGLAEHFSEQPLLMFDLPIYNEIHTWYTE